MINSMTGFGGKEIRMLPKGKISVELRSTNHKFLEIVLHLPDGFLSFEDKIKKEIESHVKRGRILCSVNISKEERKDISLNEPLLKKYLMALKKIEKKYKISDGMTVDSLIKLPGVLNLEDKGFDKNAIWINLRAAVVSAVGELIKTRQKEGASLSKFLKISIHDLQKDISKVKERFAKVIESRKAVLNTDEELSIFLKSADITEELERLTFHARNFGQKLQKTGPIGKEMDFIAQEMQREANTMGAKSCDSLLSGLAVQIKSSIEKIREQVQNIE